MVTQAQTKQLLTCSHCGHTDDEVIVKTVYVEDKGLVSSVECTNRVACWERWHEQHPRVREAIAKSHGK